MIRVSVKLDIQAARANLVGLEKQVDKAAIRALKRVATTARKEADQRIRSRLNLSSATVKRALRIVPHGKHLIVDIVADGGPIPLRDYSARMTRKGATFAVKRGAGRKVYRRQGNPGFIVDRFGRHVFVRTTPDPPGPQKAKISKVYGPSIPQYFLTKLVTEQLRRVVLERWPVEFRREIAFRTQGRS